MTRMLFVPALHVCLACLDCLSILPLQKEEVLSPVTLDVTMPQAGCCVAVGLEHGCIGTLSADSEGSLVHLARVCLGYDIVQAVPPSCNWAAD